MRGKKVLWMTAWIVPLLFLALSAGAADEKVMDIKGTVFAVDYDAQGKVVQVSILDPAGEEYFVVKDEVGDKLLPLVDKNVKAKGVLELGKDGKKNIRIRQFEIYAT